MICFHFEWGSWFVPSIFISRTITISTQTENYQKQKTIQMDPIVLSSLLLLEEAVQKLRRGKCRTELYIFLAVV